MNRLQAFTIIVIPVLVIILGIAMFFMLSLKEQPRTTLGTEFAGLNGKKMILLEPKDM